MTLSDKLQILKKMSKWSLVVINTHWCSRLRASSTEWDPTSAASSVLETHTLLKLKLSSCQSD